MARKTVKPVNRQPGRERNKLPSDPAQDAILAAVRGELPFSPAVLSPEEEDAILRLAQQRLGAAGFFKDLEDLLTSEEGFGLPASPLQRAVCRLIDGKPLNELATQIVQDALAINDLAPFMEERTPPAEVVLLSGVRTAKSMIAAAVAILASQRCDVAHLAAGEIPRFSVLSLSLDNAKVVMQHLVGALQKPRLKHLRIDDADAGRWRELMDESSAESSWSVFVWHPSGRPVEIRVIAGKRAGGSLVSRWSAGCCLDEAARMLGSSDGVINYDDAVKAVRTRLLPGAQIISISSPWQPYGPIFDLVENDWGTFSVDRVIIKARGPDMNPAWWTHERCEEIRRTNPIAYHTDVRAEFADVAESLFPLALLQAVTRVGADPIAHNAKHDYVAAMDPATRGNSWTLVIADRVRRKKRVVFNYQWTGSSQEPLSPKAVLTECAAVLADYGLDWCLTDQWAGDALRDIATDLGLYLIIEPWTEKNRVDSYLNLATAMANGDVELPDDPQLLKDLRLTKRFPSAKGITIRLTNTPDGRHCDYAPALALLFSRWLAEERAEEEAKTLDGQMELQEAELAAKVGKPVDWWEQDPYGN